jgi:hypothetical protein
MAPQILIILGASVVGLLGSIHLAYTFFTNKFDARDPAASAAMKAASPILTRRTTLWRAWIGFNASHALGLLLFAGTYLILAIGHMSVLRDSTALTWLPVAACAAYLALARRYWFLNPAVGIGIAGTCFLAAALSLSF